MTFHAPAATMTRQMEEAPAPSSHSEPPGAPAPEPRQAPAAGGRENAELDLAALLAILRRNWWIVALTTMLVTAPALIWSYAVTPLYTAAADIYVTPRQKSLVGGGIFASGLSSDLMMIESQTRVISSESVLRRVVESQHLDADPEFNGARPPSGPRAWLMSLLGKPARKASASAADAALRNLARRLSVRRAEKTFVISVSVTSEDPAKAARLANAVARAYIESQTSAKAAAAGAVNNMLTRRLQALRAEVSQAEEAVAAFKRAHDIVATKQGQLENEARLARLGEELVKARSRAAAAKAKYDNIARLLAAGAPPEATYDALNSPVISRLRADYSRAAGLAASLAQSLGPRHPRLLAARARLKSIRKQIRDEAARLARSAKSEYEAARAEVAAIDRNLRRVRDKASITNEARVRLRDLEREAHARRTLYEKFLIKAKESGEARNLQIPDAKIISPALPPQYPSFPKKKLVVGLAGLLGLGLGAAIALAAAPRRPAPRPAVSAAPASQSAGVLQPPPAPAPVAQPQAPPVGASGSLPLPVLAALPALPSLSGLGDEDSLFDIFQSLLSPAGAGRAAFAESALNIFDALSAQRTIAITAPRPAQGSTTLAWALTSIAAMRGRRVLLVDANHENPALGRVLPPPGHPDLRQALLGWARPEAIISHDPDAGLDFLPLTLTAGFTPAAGAARAFHHWLTDLFTRYDKVIIDATPIPRAVNTFDLASLVEVIALIAAPAASASPDMRETAELIAASGKRAAIVWNLGAPASMRETPPWGAGARMEAAQ